MHDCERSSSQDILVTSYTVSYTVDYALREALMASYTVSHTVDYAFREALMASYIMYNAIKHCVHCFVGSYPQTWPSSLTYKS